MIPLILSLIAVAVVTAMLLLTIKWPPPADLFPHPVFRDESRGSFLRVFASWVRKRVISQDYIPKGILEAMASRKIETLGDLVGQISLENLVWIAQHALVERSLLLEQGRAACSLLITDLPAFLESRGFSSEALKVREFVKGCPNPGRLDHWDFAFFLPPQTPPGPTSSPEVFLVGEKVVAVLKAFLEMREGDFDLCPFFALIGELYDELCLVSDPSCNGWVLRDSIFADPAIEDALFRGIHEMTP